MSSILPSLFVRVLMGLAITIAAAPLAADTCGGTLTPQTVILDHFEARDATVADVLEALTLVAEKASRSAYRPNFVTVGDVVGQLKVSVKLKNAPLSDALDRIAALPGVAVTYRANQTVIFSMKGG
jgi:hypothetical protein